MKLRTFNALMWLNSPTVRTVIVGIALLLVTSFAYALELIVIDDPKCVYCNDFRNEVGETYSQSPHAEWAPFKFVIYSRNYRPIPDEWPEWFSSAMDDERIKAITGTPTFIFYETPKGENEPREIGRITGYGGEEWFYSQMEHYRTQYEEWKKTH